MQERLLHRLTKQLRDQGNLTPESSAISFLRKHGLMKKDSLQLTEKGLKREKMTPAERAIDRASKKSGKSPEAYKYNSKTNMATLKNVYRQKNK